MSDTTTDPGTGDQPDIARTGLLGALAGFTLCTAAVAIAGTATGMEAGSAVGLGAFIGAWGGAGFGFMMGCTIPLARHMDRSHRAERG